MAENGGKPKNEFYELNDILAGVEAADESVEDILADIYGTAPEKFELSFKETTETETPDKETAAANFSEQEAQKVVPFPTLADETVQEIPDTPSAWVEPDDTELPPELLESVFSDMDEAARPDGFTSEDRPDFQKLRQAAAEREEDYRAKAAPLEEEAVEGRFSRLRAKADAFADSMYSQAGDGGEETEVAEKYIPGTDEEKVSPPPRRPRPRPKRPASRPNPKEEHSPQEMAHLYFAGLNFMRRRVLILLVLTLVSCYLTLAAASFLPLPSGLTESDQLLAGVQLMLLGWCLVFSLDVLWMGLRSLRSRLFTLHTLGSISVLFTIIDALVYCLIGREGPLPYCAPASLLLFCLTWGAYDRKLADYRACRQASFSQNTWRVTRDRQLWNSRDTFTKEQGGTQGFGMQIEAPDGGDLLQRFPAPLIALAALLLALISSVFHGHPGLFTWSLSAILIASSPLSALLCFGQPWLHLSKRLERSGAAVAGWPGVHSAGGDCGILISDADLFPSGSVRLTGIKVYGQIPLEKLAGCVASLIRVSGSGLTDLFDGLVRTQGGFYRNVDDFQCYEAGGLSGFIRGEQIMVGSANFMRVMNIPLPQDLKADYAVFCSVDGALRGVFTLSYSRTDAVRPAVLSLLHAHLIPVLTPRDFNVTPNMVQQRLKLPVERMEYPPVERRLELTETGREHAEILTALLNRGGIEAYSDTAVGCRRLRATVYRSNILCIISSVIGLGLSAFLTAARAFTSLTPGNMLIFLLLWLIPTLLLSGSVNRY